MQSVLSRTFCSSTVSNTPILTAPVVDTSVAEPFFAGDVGASECGRLALTLTLPTLQAVLGVDVGGTSAVFDQSGGMKLDTPSPPSRKRRRSTATGMTEFEQRAAAVLDKIGNAAPPQGSSYGRCEVPFNCTRTRPVH